MPSRRAWKNKKYQVRDLKIDCNILIECKQFGKNFENKGISITVTFSLEHGYSLRNKWIWTIRIIVEFISH